MMAIIEGVLLVSVVLVLYRLFFGPTQWDRLLAYNAASNRIFVLLAVVAIFAEQPTYLDVAIVYAALSFLGVVILARFMERGGGHR
jgi:multicomponent Na+:H+ antiporter subunit F